MKQIKLLKKKIFSICFLLIASILLLNCHDDNGYDSLTKFSLQNKELEIGDYKSIMEVEVISNVEWRVESNEDWIKIEKNENNLVITFETNSTDLDRKGKIFLYGKGKEPNDILYITQSKLIPSIQINSGATFLSVNSTDQKIELIVESNRPWKITKNFEWASSNILEGPIGKTTLELNFQSNKLQARNGIITFDFGRKEPFNFVVSQSAANTGFENTTHNFFITFGTLPTLYAGLYLLSQDVPSFVFYERQNTYDPQYLPSYATPINLGGNDVQPTMRDYMKSKILKINEENPNAVFGLFVDDLRARIGYDWFISQGIDSSRVKVTLLSDGTGSYNEFYNRYGGSGSGEILWKNTKNYLNNLNWGINNNSNRSIKTNNNSITYSSTIKPLAIPEFESWDLPWPISTIPNYRYFIQDVNLFETNDSYVKSQIPLMNTVSIPPYELLKNLSQDKKDNFLKMVGINDNQIQSMLNKSPKKNLVIIATNNSSSMSNYIDKTMEKYANEYDIFFARHPADTQWPMYTSKYPEITILPYMPFEVFAWYYLDKLDAIGGSQSTVFLTIPVEKVTFMYASGPENLVKPLNQIFASPKANVDWMGK